MLSMSIPFSGMQAASLRLTASANNVANIDTTGPLPASQGQNTGAKHAYQPVRVQQTSAGPGGGTTATVTDVSPSFVARYDPQAAYANNQGQVAAPNVDVMNEILNIATAQADFMSNAKVADAMNQMVKQLFELNE
jgi:flagellar basal-body rod protein FlgC